MADTWITKMSHFNWSDEEAHSIPNEAKNIAEYFSKILSNAILNCNAYSDNTGVRCRRKPQRKRCTGLIKAKINSDNNEVDWWCPVCGDNGNISDWEGTRWDVKR